MFVCARVVVVPTGAPALARALDSVVVDVVVAHTAALALVGALIQLLMLRLLLLLGLAQHQYHCTMVRSMRLCAQGQCDSAVIEQQRHHGVDRQRLVARVSIALRGQALQKALSCAGDAT